MGYYGTHTPPVILRNVLGEPGLVHGLHALPGRGQPGPARGRAQLPADGGRPHRHGAGQRLAARRGHRRRRGHGHGAPGPPQQVRPLLRRRRLPSADPGRAAHPRRAISASSWSSATRWTELDGPGRVRRAAPVPGHRRRASATRARRSTPSTPQGGLAVVATDLLALALLDPARRAGCRHRPGLGPALRRAHGLWRPARRLLRHQGRPQARHARPDHRRLGRRPRQARPAHGAADPRAAHPPRQGDQQHLHRPGAAGGHRRLLRRLARARGPDADRPPRPRPDRASWPPALRASRHRGRERRPSSTPSPSTVPGRAHDLLIAARDAGIEPAPGRRRPSRPLARRDHHPPRPAPPAGRPGCRGRAHPGRCSSGVYDDAFIATDLARTSPFLTHPVFHAPPQRDRDAALPAPPRRPRTSPSTGR